MRRIHGHPENFRESLSTHTTTFPKFVMGFVPIDTRNVRTKYEARSLTCSWDNRGYSKNFGSPWIRMLTISFLPNFSRAFVQMDPVNVAAKFEVRSCNRSRDNSDCSFGLGLWTPNLGEEEAVGDQGWYRSKECWQVPIWPYYYLLSPYTYNVL